MEWLSLIGTVAQNAPEYSHRELIGHRVNGLMFGSEDEKRLAEEMVEIYKNAALREKLSAASVEKVKLFSIDNIFSIIMGIYKIYI